MAVLTPQSVTRAGRTPVLAAASAGGDEVVGGSGTYIVVRNGSGASITVTLTTPGTAGGLAIEDPTITVAAGADSYITIPGDDAFKNVNGRVGIGYSAVTTVTVGAFQLA